jgi:hypothetical protein
MATHYNKIVQDLGNIVPAIEYYEKELNDARWEVKIKGSLEKASSSLPGLTEYRFNQLQEIEAILEHLNIELRRERSKDADKFVDGEDSVIDLTHLVNQFSLLRNKYLGIMKGLDTKQWQIGHITRLRTAGMEDIVID